MGRWYYIIYLYLLRWTDQTPHCLLDGHVDSWSTYNSWGECWRQIYAKIGTEWVSILVGNICSWCLYSREYFLLGKIMGWLYPIGDSYGIKANKKGGDNDHALIIQIKKGICKVPNKGKVKIEESSSQLGKKDLSIINCLICHKNYLYAP